MKICVVSDGLYQGRRVLDTVDSGLFIRFGRDANNLNALLTSFDSCEFVCFRGSFVTPKKSDPRIHTNSHKPGSSSPSQLVAQNVEVVSIARLNEVESSSTLLNYDPITNFQRKSNLTIKR